MTCYCEETMDEVGRPTTTIQTAFIQPDEFTGYRRVRITCVHGNTWNLLLAPGDPFLTRVLCDVLEIKTEFSGVAAA